MAALNLSRIERAGIAADQQTAGEGHLGQGIKTTLIERTGTIA